MDYDKGDIINKKGIKFKGTNQLDFRMAGHPVVILKETKFDDENIYFLTISSQVHHINSDPDRYYQINKDNYNRLRKPSIIDLKYVYKLENTNIVSNAYLSDDDYRMMLDKIRNYDGIVKDEDFKEIAEELDIKI